MMDYFVLAMICFGYGYVIGHSVGCEHGDY